MVLRFAVILGLLAMLSAGCIARTGPRGLASDDSAEKIPALKRAGETRDAALAPQIVKELSNDDPAVRFYAIGALERISGGETYDYRFYDSPEDQQPAIDRWKQWLAEHKQKPKQK